MCLFIYFPCINQFEKKRVYLIDGSCCCVSSFLLFIGYLYVFKWFCSCLWSACFFFFFFLLFKIRCDRMWIGFNRFFFLIRTSDTDRTDTHMQIIIASLKYEVFYYFYRDIDRATWKMNKIGGGEGCKSVFLCWYEYD